MIFVQIFQIYNEKVYDLILQPQAQGNNGLKFYYDDERKIKITGLTKILLKGVDEFEAVTNLAIFNRLQCANLFGVQNEKAHIIFRFNIVEQTEVLNSFYVYFVELANLPMDLSDDDSFKSNYLVYKSLNTLQDIIMKLQAFNEGNKSISESICFKKA